MSDLSKIVQLAATDPRVVAIGTEGSQNDPQVRADAWSDLDVTVFVREALADPWALVQALGQPVMWQHLLNRDLFGPSSPFGIRIWCATLARDGSIGNLRRSLILTRIWPPIR
ncbi:aminoglycoside 6-adenylyltransferase [Lacticaseibacillus sp. N501-2]|uniref:aminoglycoside 6-adenylyltransferase n=1 Tax=Lacticaseibacillus salsurae TaxID=3367729 RepID=UPI0038B328A8